MVGRISELWRYPVSSIGGERVPTLTVDLQGVRGDRNFVLVDLRTGEVAAPEKIARWRPALMLTASTEGAGVCVALQSGTRLSVEDPNLDGALSEHFNFACGIRAVGATIETLGGRMVVIPRYSASPLHLLTTSAIAELQTQLPDVDLDVRRFRPNAVIDSTAILTDWTGKRISIGSFNGTVTEATKRCGMTMLAQSGLIEDAEVLRTIVRRFGRCFGVYAGSEAEGSFGVGDEFSMS